MDKQTTVFEGFIKKRFLKIGQPLCLKRERERERKKCQKLLFSYKQNFFNISVKESI